MKKDIKSNFLDAAPQICIRVHPSVGPSLGSILPPSIAPFHRWPIIAGLRRAAAVLAEVASGVEYFLFKVSECNDNSNRNNTTQNSKLVN